MSEFQIPLDEAKHQVALVCRRLGLLHLAFAEALVDQLGDEEGKRILAAAIKEYGRLIGEDKKTKAESRQMHLDSDSFFELSDLPSFGMHDGIEEVEVDGEKRHRAYGCVMGKLWNEFGKGDLGRFYCLVDPASSMAFNPDLKFVHTKAIPDGHPYCELVMRKSTEKDKAEFESENTDWRSIEG